MRPRCPATLAVVNSLSENSGLVLPDQATVASLMSSPPWRHRLGYLDRRERLACGVVWLVLLKYGMGPRPIIQFQKISKGPYG